MRYRSVVRSVICALVLATSASHAAEGDAQKHLGTIKNVGREGRGNKEAAAAWKALVAMGGQALLPTLAAMDDASPLAANWLRLTAQAIVEKQEKLPIDQLESFVRDTKHAPISRRLAYEFLVAADAKAPERLLPSMIEDPSVEIRRDAIEAAIAKATPLLKSDPKTAVVEFDKLFHASRDQDQTEKLAKTLKDLKTETDLNKHFGVITDWMVIGPFDSTQGAGHEKAYAPEARVDLAAAYKGKGGMKVKWAPYSSTEPYGVVDLNKAIGKHKDAAAYAFTTIETDKPMPIELRFGCIAAVKIFLNGKEVYAREEYHHGQRFDQYFASGTLKAGRNELLVKVCQNNQTENWAQEWKFQLRVCDFTGGALPLKVIKNSTSPMAEKGSR